MHFFSAQVHKHLFTIGYSRVIVKLRVIERVSGAIHDDSSQLNARRLRLTCGFSTYIHPNTVQGLLVLSDKHVDFRTMTTLHTAHLLALAHNHVIRVAVLVTGANHFVEALCS